MKKLKGKDGEKYTGCEKGGLFAVFNDKKENVGNFADEAAAVQLGGYKIVGEDKSEPPEGIKNDSSAKVESGKSAAASEAAKGGDKEQPPLDPKTDDKKDETTAGSPETEKTPA